MDYQQSLKLLTSQEKFHINLGLERMQRLAELFDNPQDKFKIIHVAGTNGKGSTCAMLAKILEKNGYKTGLFTSPHLKSYTERFKINFVDITQKDFAYYMQIVETKAQQNNIQLTEFEILTMMGFLYFAQKGCDYVVLEVGIGGRLDATNIIKKPLLTIITSVSIDHKDRLGQNIEEIAFEKAGILKTDIPVIVSKKNLGFATIEKQAKIVGASILVTEKDFELIDKEKNIFSDGQNSYELSLRGINQGQNLALVIKACEFLKLNIQDALKQLSWICRFEYFKEKNLLVDAAHNPDAVKLLKANLDIYFKDKKRIFLFGVLDTKDYKQIIENLFNPDDEIYITDDFAHNSINKEVLQTTIGEIFPTIKIKLIDIKDINEFVKKDVIEGIKICCGSFYLCEKVL